MTFTLTSTDFLLTTLTQMPDSTFSGCCPAQVQNDSETGFASLLGALMIDGTESSEATGSSAEASDAQGESEKEVSNDTGIVQIPESTSGKAGRFDNALWSKVANGASSGNDPAESVFFIQPVTLRGVDVILDLLDKIQFGRVLTQEVPGSELSGLAPEVVKSSDDNRFKNFKVFEPVPTPAAVREIAVEFLRFIGAEFEKVVQFQGISGNPGYFKHDPQDKLMPEIGQEDIAWFQQQMNATMVFKHDVSFSLVLNTDEDGAVGYQAQTNSSLFFASEASYNLISDTDLKSFAEEILNAVLRVVPGHGFPLLKNGSSSDLSGFYPLDFPLQADADAVTAAESLVMNPVMTQTGQIETQNLISQGFEAARENDNPSLVQKILSARSLGRRISPEIRQLFHRLAESGGINRGSEIESRGLLYSILYDPELDRPQALSLIEELYSLLELLASGLQAGDDPEAVLDAFLQALENKEGRFEGILLSESGLQAIQDLLIHAGFDPESISGLVSQLKSESDPEGIDLSDLVKGLSNMDLNIRDSESEEEPEAILMISSLPYLFTALKTMGVPEKLADAIVNDSNDSGQGISLDELIEKLQQLEKNSGDRHFGASPGESGFKMILEQLGVNRQVADNGHVSLGELISAFEQMRQKASEPNAAQAPAVGALAQGEADALIDTVMSGLTRSSGVLLSPAPASGTEAQATLQFMKTELYQELKTLFASQEFQSAVADQEGVTRVQTGQDMSHLMEKAESFVKELLKTASKSTMVEENPVQSALRHTRKFNVRDIDPTGAETGGSFKETGFKETADTGTMTRTSPRALPFYLMNQVGKQLARAVNRGESELKLQLKPPELGRLIVTIDRNGSTIKVSIIAENQTARDILVSHTNDLKTTLAGSGISLESFEVELGSDFRQSMADARQQSQESMRGSGRESRKISSAGEIDEIAGEPDGAPETGALHFVA